MPVIDGVSRPSRLCAGKRLALPRQTAGKIDLQRSGSGAERALLLCLQVQASAGRLSLRSSTSANARLLLTPGATLIWTDRRGSGSRPASACAPPGGPSSLTGGMRRLVLDQASHVTSWDDGYYLVRGSRCRASATPRAQSFRRIVQPSPVLA
jgi:hypothetical protein